MMSSIAFIELADVEELCKVVEVEHCIVLAVLAEERNILAEIHVLEVISDKAAIAALNALAEGQYGIISRTHCCQCLC